MATLLPLLGMELEMEGMEKIVEMGVGGEEAIGMVEKRGGEEEVGMESEEDEVEMEMAVEELKLWLMDIQEIVCPIRLPRKQVHPLPQNNPEREAPILYYP